MKMRLIQLLIAVASLLFISSQAMAHCEVPCGIYDDSLRIKAIRENVTTIEKSMNQIAELSKAPEKNYNQIVRWVMNKEQHVDELVHIVTQ